MNVLYRFFSADDELLYVGITNNPPQRFSAHRNTKSWWHKVVRIEMEHFASRHELLAAEKHAIVTEHPRYNVVYARPEIEWCCDMCGTEIKDGRGYVTIGFADIRAYEQAMNDLKESSPSSGGLTAINLAKLPDAPRWRALHAKCDPDIDSFDYFIYVERLRTRQAVLDVTSHLLSKRWLQSTRWDLVLARASIGSVAA